MNIQRILNKIKEAERLTTQDVRDLEIYILQSEDFIRRQCCFEDELASNDLIRTGSFSSFDNPSSVRIAREVADTLGILP